VVNQEGRKLSLLPSPTEGSGTGAYIVPVNKPFNLKFNSFFLFLLLDTPYLPISPSLCTLLCVTTPLISQSVGLVAIFHETSIYLLRAYLSWFSPLIPSAGTWKERLTKEKMSFGICVPVGIRSDS